MKNIFLFGSTGMLGRYVYYKLNESYNIICINRNDFDCEINSWNKLKDIFIKNNINEYDIIINCVGIIPQRYDLNNYRKYIKINTLFPHKLEEISIFYKCNYIHITTDCVFDCINGNFNENSEHNANDIYGITKSLGEPENATIIRTSIIGEEFYNKKSLLEWILSNKNSKINGFKNHLWNGVTCLTLASFIKNIIDNNIFWKGVKHIFSPNSISKYELCCMINECYNLNIEITPIEDKKYKNSTLNSIYINNFKINDILTQIKEQQNYKIVCSNLNI